MENICSWGGKGELKQDASTDVLLRMLPSLVPKCLEAK